MKPIVSFSLFGTEPKYYVGAEKNITEIKQLLPDWEVRIYYHENMILDGKVEHLTNLGGTLINVKDIVLGDKESIHYPFFWRFLAFFENTPTIVRDLDSRFSDREVQYINQWMNSERDYFIIRDHPWQAPVPSGLFGVKKFIGEFKDHFINFVNNEDLRWGADQEILRIYMERINKENVFYCGYDDRTNYIPRDNKNFFIGMQMDENDNPTDPSGIKCLQHITQINL
jgi:hypothetical protein